MIIKLKIIYIFIILSAGIIITVISGCNISISDTPVITGIKPITHPGTSTPVPTEELATATPPVIPQISPGPSPAGSPVDMAGVTNSVYSYYYLYNVGTQDVLAWVPADVSGFYSIFVEPWNTNISYTEYWSLIAPYQSFGATNCFGIENPIIDGQGNLTEPEIVEATGDAIFWYGMENGTAYDWLFNQVEGKPFTYNITCQQDGNNLDVSSTTYTEITSVTTNFTVTPGQVIENAPSSNSLTQQWIVYPAPQ